MPETNDTAAVEIWKPVLDWEGLYEVSSLGRVRSVPRVRDYPDGRPRMLGGRVLSLSKTNGYSRILLVDRCVRRKLGSVHVLVLEAFGERRPPGMQCCHNDGNKGNNRADNLRWGTPRENLEDSVKHGTFPRGEATGTSLLDAQKVRAIRRLRAEGISGKVLAEQFGVNTRTISAVATRVSWKHVG